MPEDNDSTMSVYRITRAFPNMKVDSHKSYSYAPICKSQNGRANTKYNPVFYGAFDPLTAISEMKGSLALNTSFYISEWKFKPGKTIVYNMLGNDINSNKKNPLFKISRNIIIESELSISKDKKNYSDNSILIKDLSNLFTHRGNQYYHITGALTHNMMYKHINELDKSAVLIYPSVESKHKFVNIAIPPHVADNSNIFELVSVNEISMIKDEILNKQKASFKHKRKAYFQNNHFAEWFYGKIIIKNINFNKLEIKLYNDTIIKGKEVSKKKLYQTFIRIDEMVTNQINYMLEKNGFPEDMIFGKSKNLLADGIINDFVIFLELGHGNKFPNENSYSCIRYIQVPVSLEMTF